MLRMLCVAVAPAKSRRSRAAVYPRFVVSFSLRGPSLLVLARLLPSSLLFIRAGCSTRARCCLAISLARAPLHTIRAENLVLRVSPSGRVRGSRSLRGELQLPKLFLPIAKSRAVFAHSSTGGTGTQVRRDIAGHIGAGARARVERRRPVDPGSSGFYKSSWLMFCSFLPWGSRPIQFDHRDAAAASILAFLSRSLVLSFYKEQADFPARSTAASPREGGTAGLSRRADKLSIARNANSSQLSRRTDATRRSREPELEIRPV